MSLIRFTPTATTPVRKDSFPESCRAAAPVFRVEEVSAFTVTSAALLPLFLSIAVSFRPAVLFLKMLASAPMPWAPISDFLVTPTPTATVVALDTSEVVALIAGAALFFLTVVMSALLISARRVSLPSPALEPLSLSVRATPMPSATVVSLMASSAAPATVVLLVLSVAVAFTEDALLIVFRFSVVVSAFPSLSSPMTAIVSL